MSKHDSRATTKHEDTNSRTLASVEKTWRDETALTRDTLPPERHVILHSFGNSALCDLGQNTSVPMLVSERSDENQKMTREYLPNGTIIWRKVVDFLTRATLTHHKRSSTPFARRSCAVPCWNPQVKAAFRNQNLVQNLEKKGRALAQSQSRHLHFDRVHNDVRVHVHRLSREMFLRLNEDINTHFCPLLKQQTV